MNLLKTAEISDGQCITADAYIFDDLFFLPKNTLIKDYHLSLLKEWEIKELSTEGNLIFYTKGNEPVENDSDIIHDDLDNLFSDENNLLFDEEDDANDIIDKPTQLSNNLIKSTEDIYKIWLNNIKNHYNNIINNNTINKESVINLLGEIEKYVKTDKTALLKLFGEEIGDVPRLYRQTLETVILSFLISNVLNLTDFVKNNLTIATLFHDVGMLKIPRGILSKNVPLNREEIKIIQNHTVFGYKYLRSLNYSAIIASGALQHHERIDGTGYPNNLKTDKITQVGKIIAIIDAYSASISNKSFKSSIHAKEAVQDLLGKSGTMYDSMILKAFVKTISFYPIGCLVLLSNGKPAKVIGETKIAMKPIVIEIISGKAGQTIDLSTNREIYIKGIFSKKQG